MHLFTDIAELWTPFTCVQEASLVTDGGTVLWVGEQRALPAEYQPLHKQAHRNTSLKGQAVLPALVDCHTHLVWAGSRLAEYRQRARGESYEAILAAGGGIYNTVKATQAASEDELLTLAKARAHVFACDGVGVLEVKSGYGLEPAHELKMLRVINRLSQEVPQRIVPTFLAHIVPKNWARRAYVDMLCYELIPEVSRKGLAETVDVFCDEGAFSLSESMRIFEAAQNHGLKIKAHAEQLKHTDVTQLLVVLDGLSADHLEQSTPADWQALADSETVGVILPGATLLLGKPFPDVRAMIDKGVKIAIATDHNPGSSPLCSVMLSLQLTIAMGHITLEEALAAGTAHAADALGKPKWGRLTPGSVADFIVINHPQGLQPLYMWGAPLVNAYYLAGEPVSLHRNPREAPPEGRGGIAGSLVG